MRINRSVAAGLTVAVTVLLAGCGTDDSSSASQRQAGLPAPVSARTHEKAAPKALTVNGDSAPTQAVKTDTTGALIPPQDVHQLGWWADSAMPGSGSGTIVITGHVDEVEQGDGFAKRFVGLTVGDAVTVTTAGDQRIDYRVTRIVNALKPGAESGDDGQAKFPTAELNRLDGPETLALVTCGGPFVGPPLGYRDNLVVFAEPA